MQMRSSAVWLSVIVGLLVIASPAWAAPKKKHHKAAADSGEAESAQAAPVESAKPKDVDDLMQDSTNKPAARSSAAPSEPEPKASDDVGEPDAWERPPAEEEKPKRKQNVEAPEVKHGDGRNKNIGLMAGYGIGLGSGFSSLNPYGLGVGLQGDLELDNHLVIGIGGEFFFGGSNSTASNAIGGASGVTESTYAHYILGHVQVGYNIWLSDTLILRPSIWVGAAIGLVPVSMRFLSGTVVNILLAPGLTLHYILGQNGWYLGVDARFSVPLGHDGATGLPILGTFGKRF